MLSVHPISLAEVPDVNELLPAFTVAVYALDSGVLPLTTDALPLAEQVRRALIRYRVDTSHSEVLTGKCEDGTPLQGHEHAHYFATDNDHDGCIDHITIYAPRGFNEGDLEGLVSLRTIFRSGNRPEVRMILIEMGTVGEPAESAAVNLNAAPGLEFRLQAAPAAPVSAIANANVALNETVVSQASPSSRSNNDSNSRFPRLSVLYLGPPSRSGYRPTARAIFASSKGWRSATPFSLPWFPNRGGGKPPRPRDLPEAQLLRELKNRGLPEPISIRRIQGYQPNGRPLVRWLEFHTRRFKGTQGKGLAGFEIEFAEPVSGPIALGFGCHFGLGLFEPC